ncbi:trypsin-like serine peptidase [Nannocystis pusilla]|uniref:trypsin-like serine peptidase n=1 Tax=Nannocystis pusilla TaxID=889268 RepID=UPI003DA54CA8
MTDHRAIAHAPLRRARGAFIVGGTWLISCVGAEGMDEPAEGSRAGADGEIPGARARSPAPDEHAEALELKRQDPASYDASLRVLEAHQSICGPTNDMQDVNAYAGDLGVSKEYVERHKGPVGAIATLDRADAGWKFCSGTLVATNVFLTASHCVDEQTLGRYVAMNYELDQGEGTTLRDQKFYRISAVLVDDIDRDFALLRLDGDPGGQFGWTDIREADVTVGETIAIIQHPEGEPKQIEAGFVSQLSPKQLHFEDVDTLPGSFWLWRARRRRLARRHPHDRRLRARRRGQKLCHSNDERVERVERAARDLAREPLAGAHGLVRAFGSAFVRRRLQRRRAG